MRTFGLIRIIVVLFLINTSASATQIPAKYIGVWNGSAVQQNPSSSWTISILIDDDNSEVAYPSLSCGGTLTLISASEEELVFTENITYGTSRCIIQTTVTLQMQEGEQNKLNYTATVGATIANGSVTRTQEQFGWSDLDPLQNDYENKMATNLAPFAHQVSCIAQKSCSEFERDKKGWASEFVQFMFYGLIGGNGLVKSQQISCSDSLSNEDCFALSAKVHGSEELLFLFSRYCVYTRTTADFEKWDEDHDKFLEQAVKPCFGEVEASGELSSLWALYFEKKAVLGAYFLRESVQSACSVLQLLPNKVSSNELPLPLTKEEIYDQLLAESSAIDISSNDDFFLASGAEVQLIVLDKETGENITNDPNTIYRVNLSEEIATVTQDGVLHILRAYEPLANARTPLRITVQNGEKLGIGQFAIYDIDTDNDLIVDSFEEMIGLSAESPNGPESDLDGDRLPDVVEVLTGTDPFLGDSDGDQYSDRFEIISGSNPRDVNQTPLDRKLVTATTRELERSMTPNSMSLFPSPTSNKTTIFYSLHHPSEVEIDVVSITGSLVKRHIVGLKSAGNHDFVLWLRDLSAGVYFVRLKSDGLPLMTKSILVVR